MVGHPEVEEVTDAAEARVQKPELVAVLIRLSVPDGIDPHEHALERQSLRLVESERARRRDRDLLTNRLVVWCLPGPAVVYVLQGFASLCVAQGISCDLSAVKSAQQHAL